MTDVTVTSDPPSPQSQPGPSREVDGTIKDQTTPPTETKPVLTDGSTDPKGDSFLTGKQEQKADGEKKEGEAAPAEGEKKDGDAVAGAPEKYGDFKLPDGYKFDEKQLTDASALFKEMNLTQDQAQKLVDHYAANSLQASEAPYKAWADLQKQWMGDIADRFGSKADTVRTDIGKAIGTLPPSLARSFRAALDLTGAGSNPDIVEGLHIMLKGLVEGGSVRQGNQSPEANKAPNTSSRPSAAEAMYPHLVGNRQQ